ncbi:hypothetical protein GCM10009539_81890 [Cryptosporangium japonicum]|uniref:Uncharacterized protein n=2 Tax=Cryptosporangium japonicum TaxID=80872 RepID=A0ABP3EW72_9ACTN
MLLPIGHSLGVAVDPATGEPVHRVRVGPDVIRLADERFFLWALTHGTPDRVEDELWGPDEVLDAAAGTADPGGALAGLIEDGLVASIAPGTPEAFAFARTHQLEPLMLGLGNLPDEPDTYEVGLPGQPLARLGAALAHLYLWGHLQANLWIACEATGDVARETPERVLEGTLRSLHGLLGPNAAYLDRVA